MIVASAFLHAYDPAMEKQFWNQRYAGDDLVYGRAPNTFLKSLDDQLPANGTALDLGAGEGRNALYLASMGLDVLAVDQSEVGMAKARKLAERRGLSLRTQAVDLTDFDAPPASFNIITNIFVHLPSALRARVFAKVVHWLKPGGRFILEQYTPDQLKRDTGGPKDADRLAYLDDLLTELPGLHIEHRAQCVRDVSEGQPHTGLADVVQIIASKPCT